MFLTNLDMFGNDKRNVLEWLFSIKAETQEKMEK